MVLQEAYLIQLNTQQTKHGGYRMLWDHLCEVYVMLEGEPESVRLAGLYHSVYGTKRFKTVTTSNRDLVKERIGVVAEELVWRFKDLDVRAPDAKLEPELSKIWEANRISN